MTFGRCVVDLAGLSEEERDGGSPELWLVHDTEFCFYPGPEAACDSLTSLQQLQAVAVRFGDPRINRIVEVIWKATQGYLPQPIHLDVVVILPGLMTKMRAVPRRAGSSAPTNTCLLPWCWAADRSAFDAYSVLLAEDVQVSLQLDHFMLTAGEKVKFRYPQDCGRSWSEAVA